MCIIITIEDTYFCNGIAQTIETIEILEKADEPYDIKHTQD